jgi:hypothetical protein
VTPPAAMKEAEDFSFRPVWIYEGALLFFTDISCNL